MLPHASYTDQSTEDWSILDLLLIISDNLKSLVLIPTLLGLLAWGISFAWPQTYESTSILDAGKMSRLNAQNEEVGQPPQQLVTLAKSADLLDRVGLELGIAPTASKSTRITKVAALVSISMGKQDKLITLRTQGQTPQQAQQLNEVVWQHLLALTIPRPADMARLQAMATAERQRLQASTKLEQQTAQQLQSGKHNDSMTRLYGDLLKANSARMQEIATLESQMDGLTTADLVQTASTPEQAIKPRKTLIAIGAALASGVLLLLFFTLRQLQRNTPLTPQQAQKLAQLRRSLGLKHTR